MRDVSSTRHASPARQAVSARWAATAAAALAIAFGVAAPAARALPVQATCRITTYYADASMTTPVGSFSTCPGSRGLTGRRTAFFEVDAIQVGNGPRPKPPGTNPFPCEFQQNCVTNLPTPKVVNPWPPNKK
jgi:hypothetical protein